MERSLSFDKIKYDFTLVSSSPKTLHFPSKQWFLLHYFCVEQYKNVSPGILRSLILRSIPLLPPRYWMHHSPDHFQNPLPPAKQSSICLHLIQKVCHSVSGATTIALVFIDIWQQNSTPLGLEPANKADELAHLNHCNGFLEEDGDLK